MTPADFNPGQRVTWRKHGVIHRGIVVDPPGDGPMAGWVHVIEDDRGQKTRDWMVLQSGLTVGAGAPGFDPADPSTWHPLNGRVVDALCGLDLFPLGANMAPAAERIAHRLFPLTQDPATVRPVCPRCFVEGRTDCCLPAEHDRTQAILDTLRADNESLRMRLTDMERHLGATSVCSLCGLAGHWEADCPHRHPEGSTERWLAQATVDVTAAVRDGAITVNRAREVTGLPPAMEEKP